MNLRSAGLTVVFIVGVFVVGALLMNFVVMPMLIHQRNSVIVPDVRGMSEQQAKRFLERVALDVEVDRRQHEAELPEGYIVSQRPRPNETVKQGRTISVTVSLGPKTQRVPDLKDLSLRQGRLLLSRHKLQTGRVARVLREGDSRETVVSCSPSAGEEVEEGTEINLLVGVGGRPNRYMMPDLEGQDLLSQQRTLRVEKRRLSKHDHRSNSCTGSHDPRGGLR
jgi:serine/threonine-protein kinase